MNARTRGIVLAALQCALVLSVAGKYEIDRQRLPRVWVKTGPVDPSLPIRGRYLSLRLAVDGPNDGNYLESARLVIQNERLTAAPAAPGLGVPINRFGGRGWFLMVPVAFFLPEHAADPSRLAAGEELWVEVSVPARGAPRPLRLGIKKDGVLTPLDLR